MFLTFSRLREGNFNKGIFFLSNFYKNKVPTKTIFIVILKKLLRTSYFNVFFSTKMFFWAKKNLTKNNVCRKISVNRILKFCQNK